ncbi:MAG: hypothetical protein JNK76_10220 [Planctomycetales bacterium]|nr:hypothetical protein [Planctomycetales bacterium]MBN8626968.1 hypothetical protein [Planctomycetota bacterium]
MRALRVIKRFPFTTYAAVGFVVQLALIATRPDYDSGGLGGLLALTPGIWGLPYYFAMENGLPWFLGALPCFLLDFLLNRWRRSNRQTLNPEP